MAKQKQSDRDPEAQDAPAEIVIGYELLDPLTVSVSHNGKIYTAQNGRLDCPPDVAQELIAAGVLKS